MHRPDAVGLVKGSQENRAHTMLRLMTERSELPGGDWLCTTTRRCGIARSLGWNQTKILLEFQEDLPVAVGACAFPAWAPSIVGMQGVASARRFRGPDGAHAQRRRCRAAGMRLADLGLLGLCRQPSCWATVDLGRPRLRFATQASGGQVSLLACCPR